MISFAIRRAMFDNYWVDNWLEVSKIILIFY